DQLQRLLSRDGGHGVGLSVPRWHPLVDLVDGEGVGTASSQAPAQLADLAIGDGEQPRPEAVLVAVEAAQALGDGDEHLRGQVLSIGRGPRPQEREHRGVVLAVEALERPGRSGPCRTQHVGELLAEGHGECLSAQRLEHLSRDRRVHLIDGVLARSVGALEQPAAGDFGQRVQTGCDGALGAVGRVVAHLLETLQNLATGDGSGRRRRDDSEGVLGDLRRLLHCFDRAQTLVRALDRRQPAPHLADEFVVRLPLKGQRGHQRRLAVTSASRSKRMRAVAPHTVSSTTSKKCIGRLPIPGRSQRSSWYASSSIRSATDTSKARATSAGLGTITGRAGRMPTNGASTNWLATVDSCSSGPTTSTSAGGMPTSSCASRSAPASDDSPSWTLPPGNATWPWCEGRFVDRRVSNRRATPPSSKIGTSTAAACAFGTVGASGRPAGAASTAFLICSTVTARSSSVNAAHGGGPPGRTPGGRGMCCSPPRAGAMTDKIRGCRFATKLTVGWRRSPSIDPKP